MRQDAEARQLHNSLFLLLSLEAMGKSLLDLSSTTLCAALQLKLTLFEKHLFLRKVLGTGKVAE